MAQDGKPPATIQNKIKKNATKKLQQDNSLVAQGGLSVQNFGLPLPTPGAHLRLPPRGRDPALPRGASASEGSAEAVPTARWSAEAAVRSHSSIAAKIYVFFQFFETTAGEPSGNETG